MKTTENIITQFEALQHKFKQQYAEIFANPLAQKTIVVIPSLTLDRKILNSVEGHIFYEERMLCMLMLLRMPNTELTFVTSVPISSHVIDYYLHLLPGITYSHAKNRLTLLNCFDASDESLTHKVLARPRLINRIKKSIHNVNNGHLVFFNVTDAERELSVELGIPLYGCDPELLYLGNKSGGRKLYKQCNIPLPLGYEDLQNLDEVKDALCELKNLIPSLKKAVIKMNDGFSGDGNAIFSYPEHIQSDQLRAYFDENFENHIKIVAQRLDFKKYFKKFSKLGGIVEEFLSISAIVASPSVQIRINPLGHIDIISTHDQVLGGENNQVFLGASFPANPEYVNQITDLSLKVAIKMREYGVLGRFGIDFMSFYHEGSWQHYAIETNLRKGGTTHPFLMLQFLTEGNYDVNQGAFILPNGEKRFYFATDNLKNQNYKGITPEDLLDMMTLYGINYNATKQEGVMFHLISSLSQYGKCGLVSIGKSPQCAEEYYNRVIEILDIECKNQ